MNKYTVLPLSGTLKEPGTSVPLSIYPT